MTRAGRHLIATLCLAGTVVAAEPPPPKVVERYKQMLAANPAEGTALDRLWKMHLEAGLTNALIDGYRKGGTAATELILGHLLRRAGSDDEAAAAYERATKLDEKNALAPHALGRLRLDQGRAAEAAVFFEKAAALFPDTDPRRSESLIESGNAWLAAKDAEKAAAAWERVIAADPANLDLRRRLAEACAQQGLADRAVAHLEYLAQHAPAAGRAQSLQRLARVEQGRGRVDEAIAAIERALALTAPGNWLRAELQSQLIRLHQRYGRTGELEKKWGGLAAENPRDTGVILQLIDLHERLGDLDQQRAWLEKLGALAPKNAEYKLRLARVLARLDDLDASTAIYDALLAARPAEADLVFERAQLDIRAEQPDDARDRVAALLARVPGDAALRGRALEFYQAHQLAAAAEAHLKADAAPGGEEAIMALANFHATQRRDADARAALDRLVRAGDPPAKQAAAHFKIAQFLKTQRSGEAAAEKVRAAIKLQPEVREYHMLLGELAATAARFTEAQSAYERAYELSRDEEEKDEADSKLYETLRAQQPPADSVSFTGRRDPSPATSQAAQTKMLALTREAVEAATVGGWLRVARWQQWNANPRAAQEAVRRALVQNRDSIAAHEFAVKLLGPDSASDELTTHLDALMRLDPANRATWQRRAAQFALQAGRTDDAVRIFTSLAEASPGNTDALTDLALAQQRAEKWPEALATWRRVHALAPPARRKEAAAPLLRAMERLSMHRDVAEFMLRQFDVEDDERGQLASAADLIAHCAKHALLPWLRAEFEQRRAVRVDHYVTEVAFGRVLKALGESAAAFDVLAAASFASPDQAAALPELIREAEELRRLDAAVRLQAQLLRIVAQPAADGFEKLAQLQERTLAIEDASKTWQQAVVKFPRDTTVIAHAAEFHVKWGGDDRALPLLRRLRQLDPGDIRPIARLGLLELAAGQADAARECFEAVLAATAPEKADEAIAYPAPRSGLPLYPAAASVSASGGSTFRAGATSRVVGLSLPGSSPVPRKNERELRLDAIRELARLAKARPDSLAKWIARWKEGAAPSEALWALHYAGAHDALLDHLAALSARHPRDQQIAQHFATTAVETGRLDRLRAWLDVPSRGSEGGRDFLAVALGYALQSGSTPAPAEMERFFPAGSWLRRWRVAEQFAIYGRLHEAAELGRRALAEAPTQRGYVAWRTGHWLLQLGDTAGAREAFREAIQQPGSTPRDAAYDSLRMHWLLLPPGGRAAWSAEIIAGIEGEKQPVHAATARLIFARLSGDDAAADAAMRRLLALRPMAFSSGENSADSAAERRWDFILATGSALRDSQWNRLALRWWDLALADPARAILEGSSAGGQPPAEWRASRTSATALRIALSSAAEAAAAIDALLRDATPEELEKIAETLDAAGAAASAVALYRALWERDPANGAALNELQEGCRKAGDDDTLEAVLARCVTEGFFRANLVAHRDLTLRWIELIEKRGDLARARGLLGDLAATSPGDWRTQQRIGQLYERFGDGDAARAIYRRALLADPGNSTARIALAGIEEQAGRIDGALAILEKAAGPEAEAKLALLHVKAGNLAEAFAVLERIAPESQLTPALLAADALAARGAQREARLLLRAMISRTEEPRLRTPLQSRIIELLEPGKADALRECRRLRQIVGDQPDLHAGYYELLAREAARLDIAAEASRELSGDFAGGRGAIPAGVALLAWQVRRSEPVAAATLEKLLARGDLTEPAALRIATILEEAKLPSLVDALRRAVALAPLNTDTHLRLARVLHAQGRGADALAVLEKLAARTVLGSGFINPDFATWQSGTGGALAATLAPLFEEFGEHGRARAIYAQAVAADPLARHYKTHLEFARVLTAARDFDAAKRALATAFRNPANRDTAGLVAWAAAAGRLDRIETELAALDLGPRRIEAVRRDLFTHHEQAAATDAALALLAAHPALATGGIVARMRVLALKTGAGGKAERVFEQLAADPKSAPELRAELATLLLALAETDLAASQPEPALRRLDRAFALAPARLDVMRRFASLLASRGEKARAAQVIDAFTARTKDADALKSAQELRRELTDRP